MHRVYTLSRVDAERLFGPAASSAVPAGGLTDMHRYLTVQIGGGRIRLDVTFPGPPWDGHSSLPLACGPGRDFPAGEDPDAEKRALERQYCDPHVREAFIAALSAASPTPACGSDGLGAGDPAWLRRGSSAT